MERIHTKNYLPLAARLLQANVFGEEIIALQRKLPLPSRSLINSLAPNLDDSGKLHIVGRLKQANLPDDTKRPVLHPGPQLLTKALVREINLKTLDADARLTRTIALGNLQQTDRA